MCTLLEVPVCYKSEHVRDSQFSVDICRIIFARRVRKSTNVEEPPANICLLWKKVPPVNGRCIYPPAVPYIPISRMIFT